MNRYILPSIQEHLGKKILFISGPRQVGKTTLAKGISSESAYYNYDIRKDVQVFRKQEWDRSKPVVIFDELHKMKKWKLWLKGLYDEGILNQQSILVTGSAKLEIAKRVGDSLAGRFFNFRLYPFDLKEAKNLRSGESNYERLLRVGGFPEPFIDGTEKFYRLWSQSHVQAIIRQDLITTENIRDLEGIELLIDLLAERVGSTISFNALSEDLDRGDKTIKRWVRILENLYVIFRLPPYSKNLARAYKKASKYYFYDIARVEGDESQKFENLVALSLKKELDFLQDTEGLKSELASIHTKDKKEIDFLVLRRNQPALLIESKLSDDQPSKNFDLFDKYFPNAQKIQLVKNIDREFSTKSGIQVKKAIPYLENLNLMEKAR